MDEITSTRNPRIRALALLSRRRERREQARHLVDGPHAVGAALAAGIVEEVLGTVEALTSLDVPPGVGTTRVTPHVLERLADARTPQGVVGVVRSVTAELDEVVGRGLLVVLDAIADPGNAGTIVRTCDAAGATAVVLTTGSVDIFGPKAVRAAAGSTYHLPLVTEVDRAEVVAACREAGQAMYGLEATAQWSVDALGRLPPPLGLVLGNEARGLSSDALALLDGAVAIPMRGRAESLNVSAAAAVAIYAAARALHGRSGDDE